MAKRQRVVAIGLDSAEPTLVESYVEKGYLPAIKKLMKEGSTLRLQNFEFFSAETPWTTFATGCRPQTLGYWSPLRFSAPDYTMKTRAAYEFNEFPPFYALGEMFRVAAFDVPQVRLCENIKGLQVGAWGAHSPQVPSASSPEGLFAELVSRYGRHPGLHDDYAECLDLAAVARLREILPVGIRRRADICCDLLDREPWDLFLTVFGEPHTIGHNMWQVSCPDHPLYDSLRPRVQGEPMREIYEAIDFSVARILSRVGPEVRVVLFSAHGMGPNTMDLPSVAFLPEIMYRLSFPGRWAIGGGQGGDPPGPPLLSCLRDSWIWEVWSARHDDHALRRRVRRRAPWGLFKRVEGLLGPRPQDDLVSPFALMDRHVREVPFQPASWFAPLWPRMKAFALPSFSEGYIRINLKGREPSGVVDPANYEAVCNEIVDALTTLRDARKGIAMVRKVLRTRADPLDADPRLPDADIVVAWQEEHATDTVESPRFGRIGPLPHFRAGSHRAEGFAVVAGPGIPQGVRLPRAHALDLAPTILQLMGAPVSAHLEGQPIDFESPLMNSMTSSVAL